ncbi:Hypothetical Protein FCC1311_059782 [Hondaea fermentalgiana]|uniref:Uncharacterized protein n=1 Tax=Hondaea fermentalgiana TaxID=2315210 RepID=A0A2R5GFV3_9STRA|nr:Hypothetical Protein FCC1311_059782 [Hondaea fermentalgiana]|eukprot:GBG29757.1 Hypothetical Protein FCC1311_059782 [Hondaea fermentalgiana]
MDHIVPEIRGAESPRGNSADVRNDNAEGNADDTLTTNKKEFSSSGALEEVIQEKKELRLPGYLRSTKSAASSVRATYKLYDIESKIAQRRAAALFRQEPCKVKSVKAARANVHPQAAAEGIHEAAAQLQAADMQEEKDEGPTSAPSQAREQEQHEEQEKVPSRTRAVEPVTDIANSKGEKTATQDEQDAAKERTTAERPIEPMGSSPEELEGALFDKSVRALDQSIVVKKLEDEVKQANHRVTQVSKKKKKTRRKPWLAKGRGHRTQRRLNAITDENTMASMTNADPKTLGKTVDGESHKHTEAISLQI